MNTYFDSDLAEERHAASFKGGGVLFSQRNEGGILSTDIRITNAEGEAALGRPRGRYLTVSFGTPSLLLSEDSERLTHALSNALSELLPPFRRLLILGLGNRRLRADCIGVLCAEGIEASDSVFSLSPGTFGQTGLEAAPLARAVCQAFGADAVLAIDALAAREKDRLLRAVEISDTGISPGRGVGNAREPLTEQTVGASVIALGVPTVMRATVFLKSALLSAGLTCEEAEQAAIAGRNLFTVSSHLDEDVETLASLISAAIAETIKRKRGHIT